MCHNINTRASNNPMFVCACALCMRVCIAGVVGTLVLPQGHIVAQVMSKTKSPSTIRRDQARLERMLVDRWVEAEVHELQDRTNIAEERNGGLEADVGDLKDQVQLLL